MEIKNTLKKIATVIKCFSGEGMIRSQKSSDKYKLVIKGPQLLQRYNKEKIQ